MNMPPTFVVIGAGGLGCPALLGLAAGGAQAVHIVDHDRVESHNLPRQILFDPGDVGGFKAPIAAARLTAAGVTARATVRRLRAVDLRPFVADMAPDTVVLECTDAPELKFAANDACLAQGVPLVIGAALKTTAHVLGVAGDGPCYRCIFEAPPPAELTPTCASAGVLNTTVGTAGWLLASMALGMARGVLDGWSRLVELDLARGRVRELGRRRRPDCPACAQIPHFAPLRSAVPNPVV